MRRYLYGNARDAAAGCCLLALAGACAPAREALPTVPPPPRLSLAELVDSVVNTPPLDRTQWGIAVADLASGELLLAREPDRNFIPASNTKLVVAAVGLAELGPDYRYPTTIHALGAAPGDSAVDALVVVARGDPTLSARFHEEPLAALDSLADSVRVAGVRHVRGDLVVDASYFDDVRLNPTWAVGWLTQTYAAPVAAFAIEEGTFRIEVEPGAAYGPAEVRVIGAPDAVPIANRVVTGGPYAETAVRVRRSLLTDTLFVEGVIPADAAPDTVHSAVPDPADFAGRAFAAALERSGVRVDGDVRVDYSPSLTVPVLASNDATILVATWASPPLAEIVAAILQPSQNWIAEQLLKTLGAELRSDGSWPAGVAAEEDYLAAVMAIDPSAYFLRDGSGLSHQNLLTPRAILQLLGYARRAPWGDAFVAALPWPGLENSTLESRLLDLEGRLAAKTGTITHVNGLSGYVTTQSGRELGFSILTNATGVPAADARAGIDRIVRAIAQLD